MDKKGDYKYGVIFSLILGLMVVSLSLYLIFNEIWSGDDADREVCRQSIQLRSLLPDVERSGVTVHSFKEDFPLKCKTMVKEIDVDDVDDAGKIIAESMAECWALYDKGDANAFPPGAFFANSVCVPCARIHLTDEAKRAIGSEGINIENALKDLKMEQGFSYYSYLENSGKKFPAFNFGFGASFNLTGESFGIESLSVVAGLLKDVIGALIPSDISDKDSEEISSWKVKLTNRATGASIETWRTGEVTLPKILKPEDGDLMINYGTMIMKGANENFGDNIPYLFYFQTGQEVDPFEEVSTKSVFGNTKFCETWEGIPA